MHRGKTRIVPTSGTALQIGNDSLATNLSAVSAGTIGISVPVKSNVTIENCYAYGTTDGLYVLGSSATNYNIRLIDCTFESPWDGANMSGVGGVFTERCTFKCTGNANTSHALQSPGSGVHKNSIFWATTSVASSEEHGGIELGSGYDIRAVFVDCFIYVNAASSRTGNVYGVKTNYTNSRVILNSCNIVTIAQGAAGGPKDLYQVQGSIIETGCSYLTTSGMITEGGSGWANGLAAALFMNGPANKLAVDASGRVMAGSLQGINADLIQKAAKMLLNKAVQDKLTGAIRYYDDDGHTVILTHTPTESESSLTRTVS
jgi:hypothetical protein